MRTPHLGRRSLAAAGPLGLAAAMLAACTASSSYFSANESITVATPVTVEGTAYLGGPILAARVGDRVELQTVRLGNPTPEAKLEVRALDVGNEGGIGATDVGTDARGVPWTTRMRPVGGVELRGGASPLQLVVVVVADRPGQVTFDGVDLAFTVNGGGTETEHFAYRGLVCAAHPRPRSCGP